MSEQADRVRQHTADQVNEELDEQRVRDVARYADASPAEVTRRIAELDREWDVERVLEANAATLMLLSLGLSPRDRRRAGRAQGAARRLRRPRRHLRQRGGPRPGCARGGPADRSGMIGG